jgi:TolB-like protein/tRNA A-37 threonylcarbamoyl transferase component Bud32/Tfp pilus assembly protein PilF
MRRAETTNDRVCGKCGNKIFDTAPQGLCSVCLFDTGLSILTDSLGGPNAKDFGADNDATSTDSEELFSASDDYELLEEIGRGGQGVVYRARQKSLNRTVALKVIGISHWRTKAHLKRFRLEAEAAARLNHPFVVPIHEIGQRKGRCYFSMGLVEGGRLDQIAKREPMSPRQATEVIAKLARTVHYAHQHGIIHRDIKPGNILLDTKGEPHLTDFGVARLLETENDATCTIEVSGTPSYMAPEQAKANHGHVSSATDVYGLGAVLYQLLAGQPPFTGGTPFETVRLLLETEPRQPRLLNPKVDRDLSTICLKCLEKDPKRRYSSALALAEDLEHWLRHEPIRARRTGIVARGRKWIRRNPAAAALVVMSVLLASAVGVIVWKVGAVGRQPSTGIAVLPFENLSNDREDAYFAEGMQDEILTRLAKIADLKVISRASTQGYQSRPSNLSEIAKQLGVANILEGSVQRAADQVRLHVQLVNAQTNSQLWADTYDRKLTDIFGVESEIAKGIAESLQAKLTGREEQALVAKPTNNPDAYDAYLRGLDFEARSGYSDEALKTAIGFYEWAVQLDPNFASGWARLSRADALLYFRHGDFSAARRDAARKALENAQKLQLNSPETLLALGYYQYWVLRDYGLAKTTFKLVSKNLPGSSEVPAALGAVSRREGNWDESVAYWEQALTVDPRNPELLVDAAWTYGMLRQFRAARRLYDRAIDVIPNDPDFMARKAGIYWAEGDLQEAAKLLAEVDAQTPSVTAFRIKVTQLRLERKLDEAVRLVQTRQAEFHFASELEKGVNQVLLAFVQHLAGDTISAKSTAEQALNTLEPLYKDYQDNATFAALLSLSYAVLGNKNSALNEAERAIALLPTDKDRVSGPAGEENLALIQTIFGENSRAISTLTLLLQKPYNSWLYGPTPVTPALLRLDPTWDSLRADPAFEKLCEEKQP